MLVISWDATVFGVYNDKFSLYIKNEDISKIAHSGQCLSIHVIQLWIFPYKNLGNRQFESEDYIKKWMQNSQRDCNKQKGNIECGYYYFIDQRPLKPYRMKAINIHWT
ncbi:hypothetical protein HKD37_13G035560 [Glycine soja]